MISIFQKSKTKMAPKFWYVKHHIFSILLSPISLFYNIIHKIYYKLSSEKKISIPTICVGNLVIGGAGKTPVVIELRKLLSKNYNSIFVLLRGYRRSSSKAKIVDINDEPEAVGDEAILHKKYGQVCVAKDLHSPESHCQRLPPTKGPKEIHAEIRAFDSSMWIFTASGPFCRTSRHEWHARCCACGWRSNNDANSH